MGEVCFSKCTESKSKSQEAKGVPVVITFNPKLKSIRKLLSKHLHISYMDQETKSIFTPVAVATFCDARKLSSYAVGAKFYTTE